MYFWLFVWYENDYGLKIYIVEGNVGSWETF